MWRMLTETNQFLTQDNNMVLVAQALYHFRPDLLPVLLNWLNAISVLDSEECGFSNHSHAHELEQQRYLSIVVAR